MEPAPSQWQRAEQLFFAALELPRENRSAWLKTECGQDGELRKQVEAMLAADGSATSKLDNVVAAVASSLTDNAESATGRRIGPYMLVREIGRGGMGTVHHAIRADGEFFQAVAIKVIKRGMDSDMILRRFRQERHILAQLDHPNIARLLDGGTTEDGQPYLVMDFVDGEPIGQYCQELHLSTRAKLRLFLEVCGAVQDAHKKLVVHRDLKPANILVTRAGRPKLLDFGIAKWLDPSASPEPVIDTLAGFRMLTPDYASPEQVRGEAITERTDIYALGLILFELLTGEKAQKVENSSAAEVARVVCETAAEKPSTIVARGSPAPAQLRRELAGELDNIVLKAMHKDPQRRYVSVEQLARDIHNHLEGRPVLARGDSIVYRVSKAVRRNAVAFAALCLAMVMLTALAGYFWISHKGTGQLNSIAVLPFVNLGVQSSEDTLSEGLTEDLITQLALFPGLKVPSRTTVWQYRGKSFDVREAGRSMGVAAVLEGSIRRSQNQIRIVAQLISVRDGFHLWAQSYDRTTGNTLTVQDEISRLIAEDLKSRLARSGRWNHVGRPAPNSEASKDYLEGYRLFRMDELRGEWNSGIPARMQAAIDAFERATQKDPNFAAAWASLGEACEWAATNNEEHRRNLRGRAEAAARRALQLEPTNELALVTLGNIYLFHDWDLHRAEQYLRKAVEVNPRNTGIQADYAHSLAALGRHKDAIAVLERAHLLDPSSPRPPGWLAFTLASLRECGRARAAADAALARDHRYRHALWAVGFCDEVEGKTASAEAQYRETYRMHPTEHRTLAALGSLLARTGRREEAQTIARTLHAVSETGQRREVFEALVRTSLGERQDALALLERAWQLRDSNFLYLDTESRFATLSTEPRFQALIGKLEELR